MKPDKRRGRSSVARRGVRTGAAGNSSETLWIPDGRAREKRRVGGTRGQATLALHKHLSVCISLSQSPDALHRADRYKLIPSPPDKRSRSPGSPRAKENTGRPGPPPNYYPAVNEWKAFFKTGARHSSRYPLFVFDRDIAR